MKKLQTAITLPNARKPTTKASASLILERCKTLHSILIRLSGRTTDDNEKEEVAALLSEYLKRHNDVAIRLRQYGANGLANRLTPQQDLNLFSKAHLTVSQRREIISIFNKYGFRPFAPTHEFEAERKRAHLKTDLEFLKIDLPGDGNNRPCIKVTSIRSALTQKASELKLSGNLLESPEFNGKIWIAIGGDKGGKTTKLIAFIVNAKKPNSVKNLVLLGMYEGSDSEDNLRIAFGSFAYEVKSFTSLPVPETIDPNGAIKEVPVELFLIGDMMFLSHFLGHMGPTTVFPCSLCRIPKAELQKAGTKQYKEDFEERTLATYLKDAELYRTSTLTGTALSHLTSSVSNSPLFSIPIRNVSPPQLHIILGIGGALFNLLEEACWKSDRKSAGLSEVGTTKEEHKAAVKEVEKCERLKTALQESLKASRELILLFEKAKRSPPKPSNPCMAVVCLGDLRDSKILKEASGWECCEKCNQWFHSACDGAATTYDLAKKTGEGYKCTKCWCKEKNYKDPLTIDLMIIFANQKKEATEEKIIETNEEYTTKKMEVDRINDIFFEKAGPSAKKLDRVLIEMGVDRQAYRTCTFVGNHMHKMLTKDGPALLVAAIGDYPKAEEERRKLKTLLTILGDIQNYFASQFLIEDEIVKLTRYCKEFATKLKEFYPNQSVTPKMHFLVTHVPQFARRHKTLGLLSEQSLESLHAKVNGIERQFSGIRDVERRMKLMMQHLYVISSPMLD